MNEDAPVNNVGSGNIAGANGDPPVRIKKKKDFVKTGRGRSLSFKEFLGK